MAELIKDYTGSLYGQNRQLTFSQVYNNVTPFLADYNGLGLPTTITEQNCTVLYYLLWANYANSTIASSDINRFKYKLFALVYQYGPNWEEKRKIQDQVRQLTAEQIKDGSVQVYNHAQNPPTEPLTNASDPLLFINEQNQTHNKKGVLEAYLLKYQMLTEDVTQGFINRFRVLFKDFVTPELPLLYVTEED